MASTTRVILTDDIDGSEATQTIGFAYQGITYEIDLNEDHASALEESFTDWISSARRTSSPSRRASTSTVRARATSGSGSTGGAVRQWLRENGHSVPDRGRISAALQEIYDAAH